MALNETIFTILEENAIEGNDKLKPLDIKLDVMLSLQLK